MQDIGSFGGTGGGVFEDDDVEVREEVWTGPIEVEEEKPKGSPDGPLTVVLVEPSAAAKDLWPHVQALAETISSEDRNRVYVGTNHEIWAVSRDVETLKAFAFLLRKALGDEGEENVIGFQLSH